MGDTSTGADPTEDAIGFGMPRRDRMCGHHHGHTQGTVSEYTDDDPMEGS
jgi:hypothetical protein